MLHIRNFIEKSALCEKENLTFMYIVFHNALQNKSKSTIQIPAIINKSLGTIYKIIIINKRAQNISGKLFKKMI